MSMAYIEVSFGDGCFAVNAVAEATARVNADWVAATENSAMFGADWNVNVGESSNVRVLPTLDLDSSSLAGLTDKVDTMASKYLAGSGGFLEAALLLFVGRGAVHLRFDDSEPFVNVDERHGSR